LTSREMCLTKPFIAAHEDGFHWQRRSRSGGADRPKRLRARRYRGRLWIQTARRPLATCRGKTASQLGLVASSITGSQRNCLGSEAQLRSATRLMLARRVEPVIWGVQRSVWEARRGSTWRGGAGSPRLSEGMTRAGPRSRPPGRGMRGRRPGRGRASRWGSSSRACGCSRPGRVGRRCRPRPGSGR
jgi:hypothetical protein